MPGRTQNRQTYAVACSCGSKLSLDARSFGRPQRCRSCNASFTVAWGRDRSTGKAVPVVMAQRPAGRGGVSPKETPYNAFCGCGYSRPVPESEANTTPPCPGCGKIMVVEKYQPIPQKSKIQKFEKTKHSAPLLPLHLRAPLRVRIKQGAQFFDCVCGERVLIRAGSTGRPIQCPACDRFHSVEIEGALPPGPAPEPGAKPRGALSAPARPLLLGEFLCRCGEIQPPRTSRTGKTFECKKCGRKGNVEIEKGADGKVTMKPIFTFEPAPGKSSAAAGAAAKPGAPGSAAVPTGPSWTCTCGAAVEVHTVMSKSDAACPSCGRKIRLEKMRHPHSPMTMIRPVFGDPAPKKSDSVVSFEELPAAEISETPNFAETAIFETSAGSPDEDAPPSVESDAQIALCECGAEILVSKRDAGHTIQCPACADVMTVEESPDPLTRRPILTIRTLGSLDDADWKLDDFQ